MQRVRMYPNRQQETRLQQSLICCRELYNKAIENMKENFRLTGTKFDFYSLCFLFNEEVSKEEFREVNPHVLEATMWKAQRAFEGSLSQGSLPRVRTHRLPLVYGSEDFRLKNYKLYLKGIGPVKIEPISGDFKSCVVRKSQGWEATLGRLSLP